MQRPARTPLSRDRPRKDDDSAVLAEAAYTLSVPSSSISPSLVYLSMEERFAISMMRLGAARRADSDVIDNPPAARSQTIAYFYRFGGNSRYKLDYEHTGGSTQSSEIVSDS